MTMKTKDNWVAFMAHIAETEFDTIEEILKEYNPQRYIIALEKEPYNHYHFMVQIENPEKFYTKYRKRVFIDKYKLRGQAKKELCRQYGKVKDIEDLEKMASYTIKNEDFRVYNIEQEELDNLIDKAFNKTDKEKLLKDRMIQYVEEEIKKGNLDYNVEHQTLMIQIIKFCMDTKIDMRKSLLDNYYFYFRQKTSIEQLRYRPFEIYNHLYGIYTK